MKILKGFYKGVEIAAPQDGSVRPTVDHLKKNIFELIGEPGPEKVWDLFAGCGGVGLEFLSRGCREIVFVEALNKAMACLNLNLGECRLSAPAPFSSQQVRIIHAPIENFLKDPADFGVGSAPDLIFMDPPYGQGWMKKTAALLASCPVLTAETRILAEHVAEDPLPAEGSFEIIVQKSYGPKMLTLFRKTS